MILNPDYASSTAEHIVKMKKIHGELIRKVMIK
jgi:hypothetical protein